MKWPVFKILLSLHKYAKFYSSLKTLEVLATPGPLSCIETRGLAWAAAVCLRTSTNQLHSEVIFVSPGAVCLQSFPQRLSGNANMSADPAFQLSKDYTATIYFSVHQCGMVKNLTITALFIHCKWLHPILFLPANYGLQPNMLSALPT